jgi:hypothetical protein
MKEVRLSYANIEFIENINLNYPVQIGGANKKKSISITDSLAKFSRLFTEI